MTNIHAKKYLGLRWFNPFVQWLSEQGFDTVPNEQDELCRMQRKGQLVIIMPRASGKKIGVNLPALVWVERFRRAMKAAGLMEDAAV